jgi:hypothetical protein
VALRILVAFGVLLTLGIVVMPFVIERQVPPFALPDRGTLSVPVDQSRVRLPQQAGVPANNESAPGAVEPATAFVAAQPVWREVVPAEQQGPLPELRADVAGARLVAFERATLLGLGTGERFAVDVPQLGERFEVDIEKVAETPTGSRTIHGRLAGEKWHTVVLTLGRTGVFGTITTPAGAFTVNGSGNLAWIVGNDELRRHVDDTRPDYKIVPLEEAGERG